PFDTWKWGLLDWDGVINPLGALIKCCTAYTTVSEGYLNELMIQANGLERLVEMERAKGVGIVNGIDPSVWDPEHEPMLEHRYGAGDVQYGKERNKVSLCERFGLDTAKPLLAYIGRFAGEKGADILPQIIENIMGGGDVGLNMMILGSGDTQMEEEIT